MGDGDGWKLDDEAKMKAVGDVTVLGEEAHLREQTFPDGRA